MAGENASVGTQLVKLRKRTSASGNIILFLDYVQFGDRVRESIGLSLTPGNTLDIKEKNRLTLAKAESIRLDKEKELLLGNRDRSNQGNKTLFLPYYRLLLDDRKNSIGNWGNWRSCLKYLEIYCKETTTFADITPRWVQGFKTFLDTVEKDTFKVSNNPRTGEFNGLSQNSKISYFNKLRACLNQAFKDGIINSNPADAVKGFKSSETERQYLTMEEVKSLSVTECRDPYLKRAFLFACFTGLRKSDLQKLTWGEVRKFDNFTRLVFKQKKTGGQEYLDIPKAAERYLGTQGDAKQTDLVFPHFRYDAYTSIELRRWALAAGITKDFTFHCSRHTFAVILLSSGTDIYTVSKLLGHREISTTQIYAHLIDSRKQEAVNKLSTIFDSMS